MLHRAGRGHLRHSRLSPPGSLLLRLLLLALSAIPSAGSILRAALLPFFFLALGLTWRARVRVMLVALATPRPSLFTDRRRRRWRWRRRGRVDRRGRLGHGRRWWRWTRRLSGRRRCRAARVLPHRSARRVLRLRGARRPCLNDGDQLSGGRRTGIAALLVTSDNRPCLPNRDRRTPRGLAQALERAERSVRKLEADRCRRGRLQKRLRRVQVDRRAPEVARGHRSRDQRRESERICRHLEESM